MHLPKSLQAWSGDGFADALKAELEALDISQLPMQQGLSQGSHVGTSPFSVMVLSTHEHPEHILANAGIFYTGIIAGCNCADDPTPVDEIREYCEVRIKIDKRTAWTQIELSSE